MKYSEEWTLFDTHWSGMYVIVCYEMHHDDTGVALGSLLFGQTEYYTSELKNDSTPIFSEIHHIDTISISCSSSSHSNTPYVSCCFSVVNEGLIGDIVWAAKPSCGHFSDESRVIENRLFMLDAESSMNQRRQECLLRLLDWSKPVTYANGATQVYL